MPHYPKITNKVINYPEAPSGKVNIGKYIPPFEKVKNGYGYMGVIVTDLESGKLQCSICGKWYEMFNSHLNKFHKISSNDYRKKFGLLQSTALRSKRLRLIQSENMIRMRKSHAKHRYKFKKGNKESANRLNTTRGVECRNKYGVCDLQIMQKVIELKKELGKTPTLIDLKNRYGGAFIGHIHKRYGSYIKYCREIGFDPVFSSHNPKYDKKYFIEKALSNEPSMRIFTDNEYACMRRYGLNISKIRELVNRIKVVQQ